MLGKKKRLEEKMDTQVINLQAMKQVASTEKRAKKKKSLALLLLFLGLFMIIMGILYPIILDTVNEETNNSNHTQNSKDDKLSQDDDSITSNDEKKVLLSCTTTTSTGKVNKITQLEFEFKNNSLVKYTITTNENAITADGNTQVVASNTLFNSTYGLIKADGIEKRANLSPDNKNLTTVLSVDYEVFNAGEYNSAHPDAMFFDSYNASSSKEEIGQMMIQQGASCK